MSGTICVSLRHMKLFPSEGYLSASQRQEVRDQETIVIFFPPAILMQGYIKLTTISFFSPPIALFGHKGTE